jgi:fatty acid amide hydrolase 2
MSFGENPLLHESALALADRIRSGRTSSVDVVEAHIERARAVNPTLNAIVADRFEAARQEAKEADARVARGDVASLPPFHGVPCTIKESIAVRGMPNSSGLVSRASRLATVDAAPVARLRSAGAIPIGVTNTSEITCFPGANNKTYGQTRNAHDPTRTPGGSSGGEGAIIGAGGSPFGIGTDIGGSIRIPAFCNGVFGHKPSGGLVPSSGQYPRYQGRLQSINTTGPLARRAADLMPVLRVIAGPDGDDETCVPIALGDPADVDITRLRVIVALPNQRRQPVDAELQVSLQQAAYALARAGADVEARVMPQFADASAMSAGMFLDVGPLHLAAALGEGKRVRLTTEIARAAVGRGDHTLAALLMASIEDLGVRFGGWLRRRAERVRALRSELDALLGDNGVLLYAAAREVAPPLARELRGSAAFAYCGIWNALELPVTMVPMPPNASGMPRGVQVAGAHGRDHLCIAVAEALEAQFGGWVKPPR